MIIKYLKLILYNNSYMEEHLCPKICNGFECPDKSDYDYNNIYLIYLKH